ncbi:efflux RND transporter periplasmic adaptor subunit, partial [Candidatus Entotheonella palauensis]|uniref:efflux RND transporter periplasmic adaptor subunit n=1 Tax=Candidatus Entotheonella palauensis TaxID=93172 RepID=UPI001C4E19D0
PIIEGFPMGCKNHLRLPFTIRAPASGRVQVFKSHWDTVAAGDVVAELVSPDLLAIQQALLTARSTNTRAKNELSAVQALLQESEAHVRQARALTQQAKERYEALQRLLNRNALSGKELLHAKQDHLGAQALALEAALRRDSLRSRQVQLGLEATQAQLAFRQHLKALAILTGFSEADLQANTNGTATWHNLTSLKIRAPGAGRLVDLLVSNGEWVATSATVAKILDTKELRFRGQLPEAELGHLSPGAPIRVTPAAAGFEAISTRLVGPLPLTHQETRTVLVEARIPNADLRLPDGLSATAHILLDQSQYEEALVPSDCMVQDGLEWIVFRRDPTQPDYVIRTTIGLGDRSRGYTEVLSGVLEGDRVVCDGIHQLKNTGLGKGPSGGHFHADGTWHKEH